MTTASLPQDSRELALELRGVLEQIEPGAWQASAVHALHARLVALREGIERVLAGVDAHGRLASLVAALAEARRVLAEHLPSPELAPTDARRAWRRFRQELLAAYDRLGASLAAWDIHVPSLRPSNYARNVFHVSGGMAITLVVALVPRDALLWIALAVAVWAWSMETLRRRSTWLNDRLMAAFGPVAHPHEWYRVNSATWYSSAILLLALADWLVVGLVGVAVLGLGDPAAAVIGRRFGTVRIVNGRSLEGSLAFVVAGALAAWASLTLIHPEIAPLTAGLAALVGATFGAVAELVSRRVDDNFTIPLSASAGAALVLASAGLPL